MMTKLLGALIHQKPCTKPNNFGSILDVANPVHEIVQGMLLIQQIPKPHCSIFLQLQDT